MGSDSDVIHLNNGEMRCNGIDPKLFNIKLQHCMTSQSGLWTKDIDQSPLFLL